MVADLIAGHYRRGELQDRSFGDLHGARDRLGRPDRGAGEGERPRLQDRACSRSSRAAARAPWKQAQGFAKLIAAQDDDEILGVHIIGPMAGELIAEAVLAMEYSASSEDLQRTIHAHPTLSEALHEAALAVDKRAIDSINR